MGYARELVRLNLMPSLTKQQIQDRLLQAKNPILVADERLDGDCLGSALAVADWLAEQGREVLVYVDQVLPPRYRRLPGTHRCTTAAEIFADSTVDLVVVFDSSDPAYIKRLLSISSFAPTVINIDHHATNPRYGDINLVCPDSPATALVVYDWFTALSLPISRAAATLLLVGIAGDTGIFSNGATTAAALQAAADLVKRGARLTAVLELLFYNQSVAALRLWGRALERLHEDSELGLVWTTLTRADQIATGGSDDDMAGLSNFLSLVSEVDTLAVWRETAEGGVKVSLRTRSGNVAALAQAFGGGGHLKAAGFTLPETTLIEKDGAWGLIRAGQYATIKEVLGEQIQS